MHLVTRVQPCRLGITHEVVHDLPTWHCLLLRERLQDPCGSLEARYGSNERRNLQGVALASPEVESTTLAQQIIAGLLSKNLISVTIIPIPYIFYMSIVWQSYMKFLNSNPDCVRVFSWTIRLMEKCNLRLGPLQEGSYQGGGP